MDGTLIGGEDLLIEGRIEGKVELNKHSITVGKNGKVATIAGTLTVKETRGAERETVAAAAWMASVLARVSVTHPGIGDACRKLNQWKYACTKPIVTCVYGSKR